MKKILFTIILLAGIFFYAGCNSQSTNTPDEEQQIDQSNQEEFTSTLMQVYKKGGKLTCTMTSNEDGLAMNGMLYVDGKTMKSVIDGSAQGFEFTMNVLTKDGFSYTRNTMSKQGRKTAFDESEIEDSLNTAQDDTNMTSPMSFSCKKGIENANIFDLPSDIEFKNMN